jgi:small subunit ribosomal protein S11
MGKKRIIAKGGEGQSEGGKGASGKGSKKRIPVGAIYIEATFNNTRVTLTDPRGNVLLWSTSGALGFKGAKKGTPFAAAKVTETLLEKAEVMGLQHVDVIIRGVGSGRESALRTIAGRGLDISSIKDATPVPHNGPRPPRARRV